MKSSAILVAALASVTLLTGCDIFTLDTYDPPGAILSGQLTYQGEPVGVRSNGVQLELWEPNPTDFESTNTKIPVYVDQEGHYSAAVFNGNYEINLLAGNGPWVTNRTRIPVTVSGDTELDIPVTPFYTIENESFTYLPSAGTTGAIQATFNVGKVDTSRQLEFVGLYISTKQFVDRNIGLAIPNSQRERARSVIQSQLDANAPITISVNLPPDIFETGSPARREEVFVRVGVKTSGVSEMLFTQVQKVAI